MKAHEAAECGQQLETSREAATCGKPGAEVPGK